MLSGMSISLKMIWGEEEYTMNAALQNKREVMHVCSVRKRNY